jgi:hypothetical protein
LYKALDQYLTILCVFLSALLGFDNAPPDFPIAGGHQGIDITGCNPTGTLQQSDDPGVNSVVIVRRGRLVHKTVPLTNASISANNPATTLAL